jgi:hypothetical protein
MRLLPWLLTIAACAPSVEFRGIARPPHTGAIEAYETPPTAAHRIIGWLDTDGFGSVGEHLSAALIEGARRGCDALVWSLAPDAATHRALGWWFLSGTAGLKGGGASIAAIGQFAQASNTRAACIAWLP